MRKRKRHVNKKTIAPLQRKKPLSRNNKNSCKGLMSLRILRRVLSLSKRIMRISWKILSKKMSEFVFKSFKGTSSLKNSKKRPRSPWTLKIDLGNRSHQNEYDGHDN